jgi:adenosylcobyric acid synthase
VQTNLDAAALLVAPHCNGVLTGYEIHMGVTSLDESVRPFSRIFRRGASSVAVEDGAVSPDGRIFGTYLHGLFENDQFRELFLNGIRLEKGLPQTTGGEKKTEMDPFDQLAEQFEKHLDMSKIMALCGLGSGTP